MHLSRFSLTCLALLAANVSTPLTLNIPAPLGELRVLAQTQEAPKKAVWQEFSSTKGRFTVLMPGTPTEQIERIDSKDGMGESHFFLSASEDKTAGCIVFYMDIPYVPSQFSPSEINQILNEFSNIFLRALKNRNFAVTNRLLGNRAIALDGYPGQEFELAQTSSGWIAKARIYWVNQRIYIVVIATPTKLALIEKSDKFLNSFKLLPNTATESSDVPLKTAQSIWTDLGLPNSQTFGSLQFLLQATGQLQQGQLQQALLTSQQALAIARQVKDRKEEASALWQIGVIYYFIGQPQQALDYYNQALPMFRDVGDRFGEAITLNSIGEVYLTTGQPQKALEAYNQALPIAREIRDRSATATSIGEALDSSPEVSTLSNIGDFYRTIGQPQKALEFYTQALQIVRELPAHNNRVTEALILSRIGHLYLATGQLQKALELYNQALPIVKEVGTRSQEAEALSNIGNVYLAIGQPQKALELYSQALPIIKEVGSPRAEAFTLNNIGTVYQNTGQPQKALELHNQALLIAREIRDRSQEAATLNDIGNVYLTTEQPDKALEFFNKALPISQEVGNRSMEAVTLNDIGNVYNYTGQSQKALEFFNLALPIIREVGNRFGEVTTLFNIALAERNQGHLNEALTQIETALNIIESQRTELTNQELRTSYFASVQDTYKFYIDLLMQLHKQQPSKGYDALALHAFERARARSLLEILQEARADIRQGVDQQLLTQESTLQQQINAAELLRVQLLKGQYTKKQLDDIKQEIESLISQYDDVQAQIRQKSPHYANLTQPQPLTLQQIQQQVLDDNTLLLEYSLGDERSYLWAVTKSGITSYELPSRADIEAASEKFYEQLKSEAVSNSEAGMKLSQMLLAPVAKQLEQKRLLIISDGALQYIPFAALPIPSKAGGGVTPLLVEHEIVSLPSASTIAVLRNDFKDRKPAAKTVAVLADPVFSRDDERVLTAGQQGESIRKSIPAEVERAILDIGVTFDRLKYSRKEAEQILALVPDASQREQALDFDASRTTATSSDLAQYRIIHFATHGLLNNVHPELSGVILSLLDKKGADIDGFLRLNDIYNLKLPAELVVLSACKTGLGQDVAGEGLVGLTRGFMYAGAKRVVVSLWSVNDGATAELMQKFYQQMLVKGVNPVAALRAAQLEMWKSQQWKAPYYWAAFVLQGEWR